MVQDPVDVQIDSALVAHLPSVVAREKLHSPRAAWRIRRVVQQQRCMECQEDSASALNYEAEITLPGGVTE